ncbi:hypothetical protein FXO38_00029 [Capsicum annuum]|nr:hypothetical protein FXO38_00029 [Capsicum annuum]
MTDQEKIKGHPYVKEVNEPPSGTTNTITDPINEEAPHEPSLMDFGKQTPTAEQNPPVVESGRTDSGTIISSESETEVKNDVFQHSIDNIIADFSSPVSCTVVSFEAFQELIDNIIAGMSTPIIAMAANSGDISQKANLPDPPLHTTNVKVPNELRESTNAISTDSSQESIDNIIAGIFTPVVAMKMKSVSPTEINNNECQIHDTQFQLVLPEEEEVGKESATVDFPQKHPFDGYLIFHEMLMRLIEEYSDWIVEGLLKFHEKKDCGVFMVAYTEFLSDQMQISSSNLVAEYL